MPITAETFELEHFEKLERGIAVAREAYANLREERDEAERARDAAEAVISNLEDDLQDKPTREQWDRMMQFIADVERGIKSVEELFLFARDQ